MLQGELHKPGSFLESTVETKQASGPVLGWVGVGRGVRGRNTCLPQVAPALWGLDSHGKETVRPSRGFGILEKGSRTRVLSRGLPGPNLCFERATAAAVLRRDFQGQ